MIKHRNISKIKNKILPTCLQANHRDSLGEFSNTSYDVFWAEGQSIGLREKQKYLKYFFFQFSPI